MSRVVKVYSTSTNSLKEVTISGETFGDLKRAMGITNDNVVGRGRTTRASYDRNDSALSSEDTYFFISPTKMDSGLEPEDVNLSVFMSERLTEAKEELQGKVNRIFAELEEEIKEEIADQVNEGGLQGNDCPECEDLSREAEDLGLR